MASTAVSTRRIGRAIGWMRQALGRPPQRSTTFLPSRAARETGVDHT